MNKFEILYRKSEHTICTLEVYAQNLKSALIEYISAGLREYPVLSIMADRERIKPREITANVHSLHSSGPALLFHEDGPNDVVCMHNNMLCTAIFNPYVGSYYLDDIFGQLVPYQNA